MTIPTWPPDDRFPPADDNQKRIAEIFKQEGKVLVEAPPGTGKTFLGAYLALCAKRLGWASKNTPVLFLTFSRNARAQIEFEFAKFKTEGWITGEDLASVKIANYHSFYVELLQKKAGVWGCKNKIKPALISKHTEMLESLLPENIRSNPKTVRKAIDQGNLAFALKRYPIENLLSRNETLILDEETFQKILDFKSANLRDGRPSYDDFAPLFLNLLEINPELREWLHIKYPVVVLDEFQDTDTLQFEIIKRMNPQKSVILFDRFQMIYSWRGSRNERVQEIKDITEINGEPEHLIEIHRSGKEDFVRFILQLRADELLGDKVLLQNKNSWLNLSPSEQLQPQVDKKGILIKPPPARIANLNSILYQFRYKNVVNINETTAIITRGNYLANYLYENLRILKKGKYFVCRWIGNDDSAEEKIRNLLWEFRSVYSPEELRSWVGKLIDKSLPSANEVEFCNEFRASGSQLFKGRQLNYFKELKELLNPAWDIISNENYETIAWILSKYPKILSIILQKKAYPDPDMRYFVTELFRAINRYPSKSKKKNWEDFCNFLEDSHLSATHKKLRYKANGLFILTVHQSKGREFDHVIIPSLSGEGEPGEHGSYRYNYDDIEDRKLVYVAMTRAKKKVTIMYPSDDPSVFLQKWKLIPS